MKRDCRSWFFLFAWICHLWAEIRRFVCTLWGLVSETACTLWHGTVGGGQNVTLTLWFFYPLDGSGTRDLSAGIHTTIAMRQAAKQRANVILMNAFGNSPAWW